MILRPKDPCHCGSGKKYRDCHEAQDEWDLRVGRVLQSLPYLVAPIRAGEEWLTRPLRKRAGSTPRWIQRLIEDGVRDVYDKQLSERRGEICLNVSDAVARTLRGLGVAARVVAGTAKWRGYRLHFVWRGLEEFHAWVETEFDEFVDLAAEAIPRRSDFASQDGGRAPTNCWTQVSKLRDRDYQIVEGGAIAVNVYSSDGRLEAGVSLLQAFVDKHRAEYQSAGNSEGNGAKP